MSPFRGQPLDLNCLAATSGASCVKFQASWVYEKGVRRFRGSFLDFIKICADALALFVVLAGNLILISKKTCRLSEVNENVSTLHSLDGALYDVACFCAVFANNRNLFSFTDTLKDDLLWVCAAMRPSCRAPRGGKLLRHQKQHHV